jgi:hypothetical protein
MRNRPDGDQDGNSLDYSIGNNRCQTVYYLTKQTQSYAFSANISGF